MSESADGHETGRTQRLRQLWPAGNDCEVLVAQSPERGVDGSQTKTC